MLPFSVQYKIIVKDAAGEDAEILTRILELRFYLDTAY
jgi:hypothetical protein